MNPRLGETIYLDIPPLHSPTTGAVSNDDATPTCKVYEDNNDTPILSPTVVSRGSTGEYRITIPCTTGNGFEVNKSYNVIVTATVGTVVSKSKIVSFILRSVLDSVIIDPTTGWGNNPLPIGQTSTDASSIIDPLTDLGTRLPDALVAGNLKAHLMDAEDSLAYVSGFHKNTARSNFSFVMLDSDTKQPLPGLTVTAERCLDNAADFESTTNNPSEIADGAYRINLSAADLNADNILLRFTASGADSLLLTIITE